jgi:hypothetical protein
MWGSALRVRASGDRALPEQSPGWLREPPMGELRSAEHVKRVRPGAPGQSRSQEQRAFPVPARLAGKVAWAWKVAWKLAASGAASADPKAWGAGSVPTPEAGATPIAVRTSPLQPVARQPLQQASLLSRLAQLFRRAPQSSPVRSRGRMLLLSRPLWGCGALPHRQRKCGEAVQPHPRRPSSNGFFR